MLTFIASNKNMKQVSTIASLIAMIPFCLQAQTFLYNATPQFSADGGAIIFVDGDIVNDVSGHIQNKGDIYLTRDWTNKEAVGGLDPTTGTVWLYGNAQDIMGGVGTQPTTFNNLNCENGGTKTLNINTIVGGNTGVLQLKSSPFDLNSNRLIVTNPLPAAIAPPTGGYIISETLPPSYGTVQWNLGNSTGNYVYPFGTFGGTYIPFICNITTAGVSTTGNMAVATYSTNASANPNNNLPYPTGVTNLNDASGNDASLVCLDRFWITTPNNYTTSPAADVSFYYAEPEWDNSGGSTNTIVEDSLMAWRWDGTQTQWINPAAGIDNPAANNVAVPSVNTFSIWTLKGAPPCAIVASTSASATAITLGDNTVVQITAGGGVTYLWSPGGETTTSISVSPTITTQYCVTAVDANGVCADTACVTINVEIPCDYAFVPNAFSPNGDTKNDVFPWKTVRSCVKDFEMKIYNRWGNLVYQTSDQTKGWDGSTPKGKDGNEGVYAFEINVTLLDGTVIPTHKGTVTLMK